MRENESPRGSKSVSPLSRRGCKTDQGKAQQRAIRSDRHRCERLRDGRTHSQRDDRGTRIPCQAQEDRDP